jgi:hypothetical protein
LYLTFFNNEIRKTNRFNIPAIKLRNFTTAFYTFLS